MDLNDRVALVTGAASGIGRATALALAAAGATVTLIDLDDAGGRDTIERAATPERLTFHAADVTASDQLAAAFSATVERCHRIDIVANVAGVGDGDLFADEPGDWSRVIDIDLTAVIDSTRLAVRAMRAGGHGGAIVNLASLIGLHPMAAAPVYSAAKAGVVNFTRSLADLGPAEGIRVNALCPELVDTPLALAMGDDVLADLRAKGEILTPEDVAAQVVRVIEDGRSGAILSITLADGAVYVD